MAPRRPRRAGRARGGGASASATPVLEFVGDGAEPTRHYAITKEACELSKVLPPPVKKNKKKKKKNGVIQGCSAGLVPTYTASILSL